jgi:hypothetical protein
MNEETLRTLVDNALTLHREIVAKTGQLNTLKVELVRQARLHQDQMEETDGGGKCWAAKGSDGSIVRVNFPPLALVHELEAQSERITQAQNLVGESLWNQLSPVNSYRLVDDFRAQAESLFTAREVELLAALCESDSSPRVSFEAAEKRIADVAVGNGMKRYKNNVGPQVRRLRHNRGWSQSTFSAKLQIAGFDIGRSGVSKIEARLVFVDDRTLMFLAEVLKVELQTLFPKRESGCSLYEFLERLERTRF